MSLSCFGEKEFQIFSFRVTEFTELQTKIYFLN